MKIALSCLWYIILFAMEKLKVIIADDEQDALQVLSNILIDSGKVNIIDLVSKPKRIEGLVYKHRPDVLFLDIEMPGFNGLELLENLREYNADLKIVLVTAYDKYVSEAIKHNVYSYLLKPVDRQELIQIIDRLYLQKDKSNNAVI
ncbi:MAG: response regulator, partial [Bacteroidales bacterium]|nr:response regulator [Bacteroidales bacterium]